MDCRGYSKRISDANNKASLDSLGVRLGKLCISKDIPAAQVAGVLGVTKMTIYKWFTGKVIPRASYEKDILAFIKKHQ